MCDRSSNRRYSVKNLLLEMSRNSQENTWRPATLLKKRLWHRCFPVNFATFLRTPVLYRTPPVGASVHISKSIRENTYAHYTVPEPFFNKVAGLRHRCFPLSFVKFLRTPFFLEHLCWLLLV